MCAAAARTRPALQKSGIVDAAMAIAREQGLDAVSMRSVAAVCGVQAMSLYHHVRNKADLLALMAQRSLSQLPQPDPDLAPRPQLTQMVLAMHRMGIANPALLEALAATPYPGGPANQDQTTQTSQAVQAVSLSMAALSGWVVELLQRAGVPEPHLPRTWRAVITLIVGTTFITLSQLRLTPDLDTDDAAATNNSQQQQQQDLQWQIERLLVAGPTAGDSAPRTIRGRVITPSRT